MKDTYSKKNKEKKQSIIGIISIGLGFFGVILSILIFLSLWAHIYGSMGTRVVLIENILSIGSKIELIVKPLGLILGIIGLFQKNRIKLLPIIGVIINTVVVMWTLALIFGLIL